MKKLAIFATLLAGGLVPQLHAQTQWCTAANLVGVYSFVASGAVINVQGLPTGPFAAAGRTVYDGNGNASGVIEISLNGTIVSSTWHGTYVVDPASCTATKSITLDVNGATLHFFITAGDAFNELRFLATDTGTAISGTARKQS
jgi:hypothetical protein